MRARRILDVIQTSMVYLKGALKDADPKVRKEAAEVLERLGDKGKEAIPALVEAMKDKNDEVREAVTMALIAIDPDNKALADTSALKASVKGKYTKLLKRIHVPNDKASYTEFNDYGQYPATDYAGYEGIPAGYWVYVYPHWYIWGELKK
jgi:formate dehydrogenase maturation protein FdhE